MNLLLCNRFMRGGIEARVEPPLAGQQLLHQAALLIAESRGLAFMRGHFSVERREQ